MNCTYDEDVSENPLFAELRERRPELIERCIVDGWIVCVPRIGSLRFLVFDEADFASHVLVPDEELPGLRYYTLDGKSATVSNGIITIRREDSSTALGIRILFEETFYTDDSQKYKVWCVESRLDVPFCLKNNESTSYVDLHTLKDCIEFLWMESGKGDILEAFDEASKTFLKKTIFQEDVNLYDLKTEVNNLYLNCLHLTIRQKRIKVASELCEHFTKNIKLAIETYMHDSIYDVLFDAIKGCTAHRDAELNKIIRNVSYIQLQNIDVKGEYVESVPIAKICLSRIQNCRTILEKAVCIKQTIYAIQKRNTKNGNENCLSLDELLPVMVFLIIKANIANWHAHLTFMKYFRFCCTSNEVDEISFVVSTLEAVIEHIQSKNSESQLINNFLNNSFENEQIKEKDSLEYLFHLVKSNNYEEVKQILGKNSAPTGSYNNSSLDILNKTISIEEILNEDSSNLCHPLCSCVRCERTLSKTNSPSLVSCDSKGLTVLHVACMYGDPHMVNLILEFRGNVNIADNNGATPLHYAASKGHQNVILCLLHAGSDINLENMDKNTALHLAVNNGHDSCVKALVHFAEFSKVNLSLTENDNSDTPLHLASKWGYESIALLLLNHGADPWKRNMKGKNAFDVAHSNIMVKLFNANDPLLNEFVNIMRVDKKHKEVRRCNSITNSVNVKKINTSVKPETTDGIRQIERLFRAISFGDLKLTCFYMNINIGNSDEVKLNDVNEKACHPLCMCARCKNPKYLMSEGSFDINTCDLQGNTVLHMATRYGHTDMCKIFLNNNANINIQNKKGQTSLHIGIQEGRITILKLLLKYNPDLNLKDFNGNTVLHLACCLGNVDIVNCIINMNCNIRIQNIEGKTALDEARDRMYLSIIALLEKQNTLYPILEQ